jgi:hypothetical protein
MSTIKIQTNWGEKIVEISADWSNPARLIEGLPGHRVADFRHNPKAALRQALLKWASADGLDLKDRVTQNMIERAVKRAKCFKLIKNWPRVNKRKQQKNEVIE